MFYSTWFGRSFLSLVPVGKSYISEAQKRECSNSLEYIHHTETLNLIEQKSLASTHHMQALQSNNWTWWPAADKTSLQQFLPLPKGTCKHKPVSMLLVYFEKYFDSGPICFTRPDSQLDRLSKEFKRGIASSPSTAAERFQQKWIGPWLRATDVTEPQRHSKIWETVLTILWINVGLLKH